MYIAVMIIGLVALAAGAQGAIVQVVNGTASGFLSWLPGGSTAQLIAYVAIAIAGAALAGWGADQARKAGTLT